MGIPSLSGSLGRGVIPIGVYLFRCLWALHICFSSLFVSLLSFFSRVGKDVFLTSVRQALRRHDYSNTLAFDNQFFCGSWTAGLQLARIWSL